jgi:hypothetical protein
MSCNCKTKKNAEKIIKTIEDIDKSSRRDYVRGNKNLRRIFFKIITMLVYLVFFILLIVFLVPSCLYLIFSKKAITIKPFKLFKNGK